MNQQHAYLEKNQFKTQFIIMYGNALNSITTIVLPVQSVVPNSVQVLTAGSEVHVKCCLPGHCYCS